MEIKSINLRIIYSSNVVQGTLKEFPKTIGLHALKNSNLLYEFYKTRFLEHEERSDECYKANKFDKMAYKTSIIQYFFYFAP
jgi:hypothetical protein